MGRKSSFAQRAVRLALQRFPNIQKHSDVAAKRPIVTNGGTITSVVMCYPPNGAAPFRLCAAIESASGRMFLVR